MEPATLLKRIQSQGEAITVPSSQGEGTLTHWHVKPGQEVYKYDSLAVVVTPESITEITASVAGKVTALMVTEGAKIEGGAIVAYIKPTVSITRDNAAKVASNQAQVTSNPANTQPATLKRRSTMLELEILTVPDEPVKPRARPRKRRPQIVKLTTHPTNEQVRQLYELMERLGAHGHDYAFSEIQRLAFDLVLSLSERELVEYAERQRDREEVEHYGFGNRPCAL